MGIDNREPHIRCKRACKLGVHCECSLQYDAILLSSIGARSVAYRKLPIGVCSAVGDAVLSRELTILWSNQRSASKA